MRFDDVQGQLIAYGAHDVVGFEICGAATGTCRFAEGMANGKSVRIDAGNGAAVTRVRYCWADSPICTLYDESGLPAGPFELAIQ